jgi:serine protease Do
VVGDAKNLVVVLSDNTKIPAEVVIGEAACDLAILRMRTTKKFSVLRLAPVDDLMVGETVIAVGDPFGYAWSVSSGVISALNRDVKMPSGDTLTGMIQISAPINPGNSGGPLLNINGELIGIIVALREGSQNIAFAINSGTAENFLRKHLSSARVSGIEHGLACIDKTIAATGDRRRVFVAWFQGEGDIRKGDEIVSAGHKVVKSLFDLERAFWGCKPGESVEMKIVREGREMTISLTVAASNGTGEKTGSLPKAVSHPAEK